jgi:N-terminal domain of oxidoreductase
MGNRNRQVLLKRRPSGAPTTDDFDIADGPMPDPGDGEALVRGIYLSLDPYMRGRISGARSYAKPVDIGAVMEGRVVGQVVRSRDPACREGDYVYGGYGWQLYSAVPAKDLLKLDPNQAPLSTALGILGMPGLTAYVGLSEIGRPQRGETVVVSAASGRSAQSPVSSPREPARGSSALPAAPTNAAMLKASSASTPASTIARQIWGPRSTAPVRKASTFIGRMSAVRSSKRCSRGSTILAAW